MLERWIRAISERRSLDHLADRLEEHAGLAGRLGVGGGREVAGGDAVGHQRGLADRPRDRPRHQQRDDGDDHERRGQERRDHRALAAGQGEGLVESCLTTMPQRYDGRYDQTAITLTPR